MRKIGLVALVIILAAGVACSSGVYHKGQPPEKAYEKEAELFSDAFSIIQSDYVDPKQIDPKKLMHGAISGMVSSLDSYSQFLEPDEFKDIKIETKGEFGGLGVEIAIKDGLLTVIAPIDGTPAAKAGILPGDRIAKIADKPTKDITLQDAVKKLRGRPGTSVKLSVLREEGQKLLDFTVKRALIKIKSIKEYKMVDRDYKIGYIKIVEFQEKTPADLEAALVKLKSEGMQALVLDLRNNPGGLLETATSVAEKFIPGGETIVITKGSQPAQNITFTSSGKGAYTDFPMVVLVNKGSASASEIVAGAVQDHKRGLIVGANTFGKGSVQTVIPLADGSAIRLTTAVYYTPKNRMIGHEGIRPDVVIEKDNLNEALDNQLSGAVDLLKAIMVYEEKKS